MAITAVTDVLKRKREQPFIEGHFLDGVDDFTIGTDTTDETIHVHGNPSAMAATTVENGNISLTILRENAAGQTLVQVITDNDPIIADTAAKYLNWDNVKERNLWVNIMNEDQDQYLGCIFIPKWVAAVTGPAGAPNDRGRRTFTGRSAIPQEFTGVGINCQCELLFSGENLRTHTPTLVPGGGSKYAIGIRGIASGPGDTWETEMLVLGDITAAMVSSTGVVDWSAIAASTKFLTTANAGDATPTPAESGSATEMTHVMVYFLHSGDGVYPSSGSGIDMVPDVLTRSTDPNR
jgi:hypothetical protein